METILRVFQISYEECLFGPDCCEQSITGQSVRSQETASIVTEQNGNMTINGLFLCEYCLFYFCFFLLPTFIIICLSLLHDINGNKHVLDEKETSVF